MDELSDKADMDPKGLENAGGLSKNQQKKLKKQMRWQENKKERRKADKEKKKQRLQAKRDRGEDIGPSRKNLKHNTMKDSSCKIRVVLDLSLDEYMADKDITSLTSQIQHSYSANRRAQNPMQLYCCGLGGRTRQRLDGIGDYKGWDVHFKEESYVDVFPKESIVYLSAESPNVLTTLSEDQVYVIGGLVDHNSRKGLCHRLAEEKGVNHAQLPISEFIQLKGRKVLAVNHVFSILLRFTELGDWKKAFMEELPKRKGFGPVLDAEDDNTSNDNTTKEGEEEVDDEEEEEKDAEGHDKEEAKCVEDRCQGSTVCGNGDKKNGDVDSKQVVSDLCQNEGNKASVCELPVDDVDQCEGKSLKAL